MLRFSKSKHLSICFLKGIFCVALILVFGCKPNSDSTIAENGSAVKSETQEAKVSQKVSIDEVADLVSNEKYRMIDLRTVKEVQESGTIQFSNIMDFRSKEFEQQVDLLDKEDKYILYCKGGGRSAKALKMFNAKGFKHVKEMHEGYDAWAEKFLK